MLTHLNISYELDKQEELIIKQWLNLEGKPVTTHTITDTLEHILTDSYFKEFMRKELTEKYNLQKNLIIR